MKAWWMILCILTVFICVLGSAYGDEIIYSQNFDNLKDGNLDGQDGWKNITADMGANIISPTIQSKVALKQVSEMILKFLFDLSQRTGFQLSLE